VIFFNSLYRSSVASKYDLETNMEALAARKFSLFPQATSRTLLSRTLFQSQSTFHRDSQFSQHPRFPRVAQLPPRSSPVETPLSEAQPGRKRAPTPRSSVGGYHTHSDELLLSTLEPPSAPLNHATSSKPERGVTSTARCRDRASRPCNFRTQ
jgi:hypothetical protein